MGANQAKVDQPLTRDQIHANIQAQIQPRMAGIKSQRSKSRDSKYPSLSLSSLSPPLLSDGCS